MRMRRKPSFASTRNRTTLLTQSNVGCEAPQGKAGAGPFEDHTAARLQRRVASQDVACHVASDAVLCLDPEVAISLLKKPEPAKLNGVGPLAWLTDVLERMVSGRTKAHELEWLLPWAWRAERLLATVEA